MRLQTLRGLASVPAVHALAVSLVLWLAIFVYCNWTLWREPHGAYFHSDHAYDLDYSLLRQQEARAFLQQYSNASSASTGQTPSPPQRVGEHPVLCAALTTIRRTHPDAAHYFSDSVGSMLAGLSPRERAAVNITVLFANADGPTLHPDFGAPWLSALVDHAAGYEGMSAAQLAELRRQEETEDFQSKGVYDYTYALEKCYRETRAPFIAVFEDDIIFSADWLARTLLGLQHLATAPADKRPQWLYLRLFYSETYLVWDAETDWWYGHIFTTFALASLSSAVLLLLLRQGLRLCGTGTGAASYQPVNKRNGFLVRLRLRLDLPTIAVLSLIVVPAFTALTFMAGKYSLPMYSLRGSNSMVGSILDKQDGAHRDAGVLPMDKHGCCSQALVFDRARVPELIAYLRGVGRGQTDMMIEDYCDQTHLRRFALGEQVVQHVGVISSRGGGGVHGPSVWAFHFEEGRQAEVEKKKQKALQNLNWELLESLQAGG